MNTVIIDDEQQSHEVLKNLLSRDHPDFSVVASGYNVNDGLQLIRQHHPDLIFLDVEMPDGSGFDLLSQVGATDFNVVFITAHNEYAVTAFQFGALHFMLKPITKDTLDEALRRVHERWQDKLLKEQLRIALETLACVQQKKLPQRMSVSTLDGIRYIPVDDLVCFEADGGYTDIYFLSEKKCIKPSVHLGEYETQFEPYREFMRVHRHSLVNLLMVVEFNKGESFLLMKNGMKVDVSKVFKDELMRRLGEL